MASGCEFMKCTDLKDGICHYPENYCKYNTELEASELLSRIHSLESAMQEFNSDLYDMRTTGRFNNLGDLKNFLNENEGKFKQLLTTKQSEN